MNIKRFLSRDLFERKLINLNYRNLFFRVDSLSLDPISKDSFLVKFSVEFLHHFGLNTGKSHFSLVAGMIFDGTTGVYGSICRFCLQMNRKELKVIRNVF